MIFRPNTSFAEEIVSGLDTKIIGRNIYYFETIDSTNLFAKKLVEKGIEEGVVVVADIQESGRGRKNRKWSSPRGGLWFSIILYPNIIPERAMIVTMMSSVATAESIRETSGFIPVIKWPNDLLINEKKVCGILTEIDAEMDKINYAIVGIGVNVNNEVDKELQDFAISLKQINRCNISRMNLFRSILRSLDHYYTQFLSKDYEAIRKLWLSYAKIIGRKVEVRDEDKVTNGIVSNVDDSGGLILQTNNGKERIISGDLKYL